MGNEDEAVSTGLTARVADSYGYDPHEHKPSQDPFDPDGEQDTEAAQGETGGVEWDGTSSSPSESSSESSPEKSESSDSSPAPTTVSPTVKDPTASSTARSTGTARKK